MFTNSFGQPDRFFTVFLFLTKSLFLNLNLITGLHRWSCTTFIYMSVSPGNCCLFFKIGSHFAFSSLLRHCWSSLEQLGTIFTLFHFERTGRDAAVSYRCSSNVIIPPRLEENDRPRDDGTLRRVTPSVTARRPSISINQNQ